MIKIQLTAEEVMELMAALLPRNSKAATTILGKLSIAKMESRKLIRYSGDKK